MRTLISRYSGPDVCPEPVLACAGAFRVAAVLARHGPPARWRQRGLSGAHRRPLGRIGCEGHAAHRAISGCAAPRSQRRRADQPRGRPLLRLCLGGAGDGRGADRSRPAAAGAAGCGRRHPERVAVHGPPRFRPTGCGACAPLPSRAVAGGGSGDGQDRLVRGVEVFAAGAPSQPVRHRVPAVGAET